MTMLCKRRGFTLIELLVAVAIFAVMAALAFAGLDVVLRQRSELEEHYAHLHAVQRTYEALQRDLSAAVARPVRDQLGGWLPALRGVPGTAELGLTRSGYPNPAQVRRSHLLRVRYVLRDQRFLRMQWAVLDRAPGDKPQISVLLKDVSKLSFRYLDTKDVPQSAWPPATGTANIRVLPRAVRVRLTLKGESGSYQWTFSLP